MKHVFLLLLVGTVAASCKHHCASNPYPIIKFVNFDSADLNTVIVTTTASEGPRSAQTAIYTSRKTGSADTQTLVSADTMLNNKIPIGFFTDANVTILSLGRTYTIRGVSAGKDTWKDVYCTNSLKYTLNDTVHVQPMVPSMNAQGYIVVSK
jgi:hypothetical protein